MKKRSILVLGFGSIGKRHINILREFDLDVKIVSRRESIGDFHCLSDAFQNYSFDYILITTETGQHGGDLKSLQDIGYTGKIIIEKPLVSKCDHLIGLKGKNVYVAYNMRFHPVILMLKKKLFDLNDKVIMAHFHVGQALDTFREDSHLREYYSKSLNLGGGVLRDLSHELDLALWLFGDWKKAAGLGGRFSKCTTDSDDAWTILFELEKASIVSVSLNYLDMPAHRRIHITTQKHSIIADLLCSTLEVDGKVEKVEGTLQDSYLNMWFEILELNTKALPKNMSCFKQGKKIVELIEKLEKSNNESIWIN